MNSVQIKLYDLFRRELNLPDEKALTFVAVEGVVEQEFQNDKQAFSTKEDVRILRGDIHALELKLEQSKVDLYKAMFLTGIVQLLAILGGVLAIVKYAGRI